MIDGRRRDLLGRTFADLLEARYGRDHARFSALVADIAVDPWRASAVLRSAVGLFIMQATDGMDADDAEAYMAGFVAALQDLTDAAEDGAEDA